MINKGEVPRCFTHGEFYSPFSSTFIWFTLKSLTLQLMVHFEFLAVWQELDFAIPGPEDQL